MLNASGCTDSQLQSDQTSVQDDKIRTFGLGDTIQYKGMEMVPTSLEKAIHEHFTDFGESEYYRLTYTLKNTNDERIEPCRFESIFLDSNGHQIDDSFGVMDDGFSGDVIFPDVTVTDRIWFETNNDIEGDITIYLQAFTCDAECQELRKQLEMPEYVDTSTCPEFEIKLEILESEILTPDRLALYSEGF